MIVFSEVIKYLESIGIRENDIYVGDGDRNEYFIRDGEKIFFYDLVVRSMKIIIEYNGVIFHPKLEKMDEFKPLFNNSTIELYNKQKYKVELAESLGFKVLEIWSDESNKLEKCLDFIKNNINNAIK